MSIRLTLLSSITMLCAISGLAQNDFDFSSQRGEVMFVNPVPGFVVEHNQSDYVINPQPQQLTQIKNDLLVSDCSWRLDVPRELRYAVPDFEVRPPSSVRLSLPVLNWSMNLKPMRLTVRYGDKQADRRNVDSRPGAYRLTIDKSGVQITGRDKAGAFYGLQTLAQILRTSKLGELTFCDISDWPEIPRRGIVEGFYGTPWSHEVRLSLIDFCGRNKLNTYVFGPKDDPYHSSPHWRKPYPPEQARRITELVEASNRNCVDFVWAIHPGKDIRWDDADRDSLVAKFEMMYRLGVRNFAIFFDDIEGLGTDPRRQVELLNYLDDKFVRAKKDVGPLAVCPTDYSRLWATPREGGPLDTYGKWLNPSVGVFYTGDVVCSDLTKETLDWMNKLIRRPAYYWWNFPVSDYARNFILQGPAYGLDTAVTAADTWGVLSNPMEHGEASKTALYSLADYTWNPAAYNPLDSWHRALAAVAGIEAAQAYRDFAIHSADTRTGYRRDESWLTPLPDPCDPACALQTDSLLADMARLDSAATVMRRRCSNPALLAELEPWLEQGSLLARRIAGAVRLSMAADSMSLDSLWTGLTSCMMNDSARAAYEAHTLGTLRLEPYYSKLMARMAHNFYTRLSGSRPVSRRVSGTYLNLASQAAVPMTDGDTATFYHSGQSQRPGDMIILDLGVEQPVELVELLQGRHGSDTDYYDSFVIQSSIDGEHWTALTDTITGSYTCRWQPDGDAPVARYVRLCRGDSRRTNWVAIKEFSVNPRTPAQCGLTSVNESPLPPSALTAIDSNPLTGYMVTSPIRIDRTGNITLLMSEIEPGLFLTVYDTGGNIVSQAAAMPVTRLAVPTGGHIRVPAGLRLHEALQTR